LYGVVSYAVRQSIAEIGIRMALGAEARRVLRFLVGQGARLTALGLVLGVIGALSLSCFLASLLFGVAATDAATVVWVALALTVMTLLACYVPARWATRTDPMDGVADRIDCDCLADHSATAGRWRSRIRAAHPEG
jgi:ABC-type antimicrobial peptide transport system permease subunit